VDTSDSLIGRRGDLFRPSHARLLSGLSAKMICVSASAFFIVVYVAATRDLDGTLGLHGDRM
jgi:hypothetical protein